MKTRIEVIENFVKTGNCGDVSCHYECPFFSKKNKVCKIHNTSLYKSIYELRKKNEQLKAQIEQLKRKMGVMQSCYFNSCIGCNDKKCEVKE